MDLIKEKKKKNKKQRIIRKIELRIVNSKLGIIKNTANEWMMNWTFKIVKNFEFEQFDNSNLEILNLSKKVTIIIIVSLKYNCEIFLNYLNYSNILNNSKWLK